MSCRPVAVGLLLAGAACSSLSHSLRQDLPPPHTLALLPVAGDAPWAVRELARGVLAARLQEQGYQLAEPAWVDRQLAERGWMQDPEAFSLPVPLATVCAQLQVDGALAVEHFDESRFNLLLLRRHALSAELRIAGRDGAAWWQAANKVATTGGFLLQSGQVLTELRAQGMHGTSAATIALVDALLEDVVATLPRATAAPAAAAPADLLGDVHTEIRGAGRLQVRAGAPRDLTLSFDVGEVTGVPMAGGSAGFTGAIDAPPAGVAPIRVRARDAFGRELQAEGRR